MRPKKAYVCPGKDALERGDFDCAIADCNEAIRLDPKNAWAYCNRAVSYQNKGEYVKAITDLTEAIHLDPKNATEYFDHAVRYQNHKRMSDKEIADCTEAIRLDPEGPC